MKKLITLSLALLTLSASARLGETKEQCIKRYGKTPLPVDESGIHTYQKGDYLILIFYASNEAISITYSRTDKNKLDNEEISTFLKANKPQEEFYKWLKSSGTGENSQWTCVGASKRAVSNGDFILIYDSNKYDPEKKNNAGKNLDGF